MKFVVVVDLAKVQTSVLTPEHQTEFFKAYEKVYSSREEVKTFYGRFIQNGWISAAWKNGKLIGVLTWAPREAVKHRSAEMVDFWVRAEERRKGIGGKLYRPRLFPDATVLRMFWRYTITAKATPLPYETDIADNILTDGIITVTIPGDVDEDFDVDIYDLVTIASAYGSKPPGPRYQPNWDINCDEIIDIYDIVIASVHYGQRW